MATEEETFEEIDAEVDKGFVIDLAELKMTKEAFASGAYGTNPDDVKQVEREIRYFKTLSHPHLVQFFGMAEKGGEMYIVTEYVPGGNLRYNLRKDGPPVSWETKFKIAYEVATAIAFLHSKNTIHRDIKSENILVGWNWNMKLCDLGLSRKVTETKKKMYMTLCGTEDFMAPEVTLGMEYDAYCDIFSYGLVLLEIITQEHIEHAVPRGPQNCFGLDVDAVKALAPPDCPPKFLEIALKCCEYEPKDRYDANQLVLVLRELHAPPDSATLTGGTRQKFLRKLRLRNPLPRFKSNIDSTGISFE